MESASTPRKMIPRSEKHSSDGSNSPQFSENKHSKAFGNRRFCKEDDRRRENALEDTLHGPGAEFEPSVHFDSDNRLSGKLPPGYNDPSTAINDISLSSVLNCSQPASFRQLRPDDNYKHVTLFLHAFLI